MIVAVQEAHGVPLVSLALRYIGGERASPLGQSGLAGLTASVMTRSTKHLRPGDYERLLAAAGGLFSSGTTIDASVFRATVPAARIDLPFWLWSDQMGFFDGSVDDAQLATQRAIRANGTGRSLSTPLGRLDEFADEELYSAAHPPTTTRFKNLPGIQS